MTKREAEGAKNKYLVPEDQLTAEVPPVLLRTIKVRLTVGVAAEV